MAIVHDTNELYKTFDGTERLINISYDDAETGRPILFLGHGFNGTKANFSAAWRERMIAAGFVVAAITMRKDAGAFEVLDVPYAFDTVRKRYALYTSDVLTFAGYSGGGGNAYSIVTKMPDLLNYIIVHFGMSDYESWWNNTAAQRTAIETAVGGTPSEVPDNYAARSALDTISNCLTTSKIVLMHDEDDTAVPVEEGDDWNTAAGALNFTYLRTDDEDAFRALHGDEDANKEFENNEPPQWAGGIIADIAGVSVPAKTLPASGTLEIATFVRTARFLVKLTDSDVATLTYADDAVKTLTVDNTNTSNDISGMEIEWYGNTSLRVYQLTRTNTITTDTEVSNVNSDYHGVISIDAEMDADEVISWEILLTEGTVENMAAFKFKVKTDNTGPSNDDQFTVPLRSGRTYNFDIVGSFTGSPLTVTTDTPPTLTFPGGAGTYELEITENISEGFPTIYFNNGGDKLKFIEITQWGTNKWTVLVGAFYGCTNLIISATDASTAVTGSVANFTSMLRDCSGVTAYPLLDTSSATAIDYMCRNCTSMATLPLIATPSVATCVQALMNCILTEIPLLNLVSMTDGTNAFFGVTLDTDSYTAFLINLAAINENASVPFHGGNSKYYGIAVAARAILTSDRSWTITDGGQETEAFGTLSCTPNIGVPTDTVTINNTGDGFYDTMVVKEKDASGTSFDNITVLGINQLTADIPAGFIGPNIYVANPGSEVQTIVDAIITKTSGVAKSSHIGIDISMGL